MDQKVRDAFTDFIRSYAVIAEYAQTNAANKGFWDKGIENRNRAEMFALMHSEISEALEADRHGNPPSVKAAGFSSVAEELADEIIRIMDYSHAFNENVPGAMCAKMLYNEKRERKHGKQY